MTPTETVTILRRYNIWRRGNLEGMPQPDPREIGKAIDAAIEMIERLEAAERQVPICRAEDLKHAESLLPMLGLKPENRLYALPGAQPTPSVPEPLTVSQAPHSQYAKGWNDCIKAMAEAKP